MLPARHRLRAAGDFASVIRGPGGARAGSRLLVVHAHRTDTRADSPPRVGFVVSKAVGGAVQRNLVKRRLRELARTELGVTPAGVDVVVRANPGAAEATYDDLRSTLNPLWHRAVRRVGSA